MHAEFFILQVCKFLDIGDAVYRFHAPSRYLSRLPGVVVVDCDLHHRLLPSLVEAADVLVLGAHFDTDVYPLLERRRATGRATVFEANDFYDDIQSWNPLAVQWQDRGQREAVSHGLNLADGVQTSTPELVRRWRERTPRPVAAFANQLEEVPPLTPPPVRPLTIGWGGSPGHFADWYHVAPALEQWVRAHPDTRLAVMTNPFARPFLQLPPERYQFTPFGSLADYLKFLAGLDIGLAPLLPTAYNRCRSDVKFLEYASRGVAGIYADLEPYRDSVVPGRTGLLYRTLPELLACLDRLAGDPELRRRIREQAHAQVAGSRLQQHHADERLAWYRSLLTRPGQGYTVPEQVLAAAVRDGRYLQLRPERPEEILQSNIKGPATGEAVGALTRLVNEFPTYLAALQHLGRSLNDLLDFAGALRVLERARPLDPHSARTLCEIGRALFQLQEEARARQVMENALEINPYYQQGWQYFLRLLAFTGAADGSRWAERARRYHPANYPLALAGLKLFPAREAVVRLREVLDACVPTLTPPEMPGATAAFSAAIKEIAGPLLGSAEVLALLQRAWECFPRSALLANGLGQALILAGRHQEAYRHLVRALELRRLAQTYQAEYPKEDGAFYFGQFAENILAATESSGSPEGAKQNNPGQRPGTFTPAKA